jgi:AraC-like DNA-binding protein
MSMATADFGRNAPRVWTGSARNPIRFVPVPKPQAVRLFHRALKRIDLDQMHRAWAKPNRRKTPPHSVERVLRAMIFDFLNFRTGRLDPSYAAIARAAGCSVRTAKRAIKYLGQLKILSWVRRCFGWTNPDGRYQLDQDTNAYWLNSQTQWSKADAGESPAPFPETYGAQPPLPDLFIQAMHEGSAAAAAGATEAEVLIRSAVLLEAEPNDPLNAARARMIRNRAARILAGEK